MGLPLDIRLFHIGTHANIPVNWSRDTAYDDKFLQIDNASFTTPSNAGGGHTHTIESHQHTADSHVHPVSGGPATDNFVASGGGTVSAAVANEHIHASRNSGATTIIYDASAGGTTEITTARPSFIRIIVIKPDDAFQEIPDDMVCLGDEATLEGFTAVVSMEDRFMLGMTTGGDGGGTGGADHGHANISSHNHPSNPHVHSGRAGSESSVNIGNAIEVQSPSFGHHKYNLASTTSNDSDNKTPSIIPTSSEPDFTRLMAFQNTSGIATTPTGAIMGWVGAVADVPSDFEMVTSAYDKQIKLTTTSGEIGDTGGNLNNHSHSADHNHTITGDHIHVGSGFHSGTIGIPFTTGVLAQSSLTHTHNWTVTAAAEPDLNTATINTSSVDGRADYRTLILIKKILSKINFMMGCNF